MKKINRSVYSDVCKYNYVTRRETGACLNTNFVKKARQGLTVNKLIYKELKEENKELEQLGYEKVIMAYIDLYRCILFDRDISRKNKKTELKEIRNNIWKKNEHRAITNKKNRITMYLLKFTPFIYKSLYNVYDKIRVKNIDV